MTAAFEENRFHRIARIAMMLATGDFAPLAYNVWLRLRRLESKFSDSVSRKGAGRYGASGGPKLAQVLRSVDIPSGSVVIDYGVGMGIAALTLSRYFSLVIGVDRSAELIAVARRNIARMKIANIELHCIDARSFTDGLDRATHIYLYNPFFEPVMSVVMENIGQSLKRAPRRLMIIYKNPLCHMTIVAAGFTHTRTFRPRYSYPVAVYESPGKTDQFTV